MKLSKISLIAAVLGGLLACTSIVSAQETGTNAPGGGKKGGKGKQLERMLERYSTELNLTDDQKPKVKAALEKRGQAMREARDLDQSERREKMQAAQEEMTKSMKAALKPDQFDKWQELDKADRAKKKKGGGGPGGPGGDTKQ